MGQDAGGHDAGGHRGAGVTVGVVGAGQLGRMLQQAAIGIGVPLRFLGERADDPALAVAPSSELGSARSADDLERFAACCDVLTFEHELVDVDAVRGLERSGRVVHPSAAVLAAVADKVAMRRAVEAAGLPVPGWREVADAGELASAVATWPACAIKLSTGGYDGRGVFLVGEGDDGVAIGSPLLDAGCTLLVEPLLAFDAELAVVVARRPGGDAVAYDPVATLQIDGQCREVVAPAGIDDGLADEARSMALELAAALDVVGLLAVELFDVGGRLLVNELAVRPHNTAHHTIDACPTSQFEQHLRAVLDLPLGSTELFTPAAMVNVIGAADGADPRDHLAAGLATDPAARVHLYGKEARPNRKVGHVTVLDQDPVRAARRAWHVVAALRGDVPDRVAARMIGSVEQR